MRLQVRKEGRKEGCGKSVARSNAALPFCPGTQFFKLSVAQCRNPKESVGHFPHFPFQRTLVISNFEFLYDLSAPTLFGIRICALLSRYPVHSCSLKGSDRRLFTYLKFTVTRHCARLTISSHVVVSPLWIDALLSCFGHFRYICLALCLSVRPRPSVRPAFCPCSTPSPLRPPSLPPAPSRAEKS